MTPEETSNQLFERMKAGMVRTVDADGRVWWTLPGYGLLERTDERVDAEEASR
jgi:hypothetical protein